MSPWLQAALAGRRGGGRVGLVEPLDQRLFRFPYSDIAILGQLVTRGPHWRAVGLGAARRATAPSPGSSSGRSTTGSAATRSGSRSRSRWSSTSLTYPLTLLTDRFHPARGAPELPPMARSGRAFAQATFRHLLFGVVLGLLVSV